MPGEFLKNYSLEDTPYLLCEIGQLSVYHSCFKENLKISVILVNVDTEFPLRVSCPILRKSRKPNYAHLFEKNSKCVVEDFVDVNRLTYIEDVENEKKGTGESGERKNSKSIVRFIHFIADELSPEIRSRRR